MCSTCAKHVLNKHVLKKLRSGLAAVRRVKPFLNQGTLITLYYSLMGSHLQYCISSWYYGNITQQIQTSYRKCVTNLLAEVESRTQGSMPRPRTQKNIPGQGQGQPFRGQTLSRPRTGMLEAKAKDQGHKRKCPPKKKKVFTKIFQAISKKKKRSSQKFFKRSPLDLRGQGQGLQNLSSRPRTSSRTPPLFIRLACGRNRNSDITGIRQKYEILTIDQLLSKDIAVFMFKQSKNKNCSVFSKIFVINHSQYNAKSDF